MYMNPSYLKSQKKEWLDRADTIDIIVYLGDNSFTLHGYPRRMSIVFEKSFINY